MLGITQGDRTQQDTSEAQKCPRTTETERFDIMCILKEGMLGREAWALLRGSDMAGESVCDSSHKEIINYHLNDKSKLQYASLRGHGLQVDGRPMSQRSGRA